MREKVLIKATIRQYFLKKNSTPGSHRKPMATSYLFVVGHWQLDIFNIILKTAKTWPNVLLWSLRWIHIYVGGGVIYYNANFQVPRGRGFDIGPWQKWSYSVNFFYFDWHPKKLTALKKKFRVGVLAVEWSCYNIIVYHV